MKPTHDTPSSFVISITPFDDTGALDEAALRRHLARMAEAGVGVYLVSGGSSEAYALTDAERRRVLEIGVEELKGRVPVRAMGREVRLARDMVAFVREAEAVGVDAVHVYSLDMGHGAKPTPAEMEAYYEAVIPATSLPVVLSSHQVAGYMLPIELIERLADRYANVAGIVCATSSLLYLAELIRRLRDRIEIHCGGPANGPTVLALGGHGFLSNESNLAPGLAASVIAAFRAGDVARMGEGYARLMALHEINQRYGGSSMRAMKPLLGAFGLPGGTLRLPRMPIGSGELAKVVREVLALGIPGLPAPVLPGLAG